MNNPEAHYLTTGPEIWEDTDGQIDCLVSGIGTGGTVSGTGKYLKEKAKEAGREIRISCPDPHGSIYKDEFYTGKSGATSTYRVEGIGHDFMVGTLDFSVVDDVFNVSDKDSFLTTRRLAREEGIFCGGSSGTAVFGALQVARELGPGKLVVVVICDSGDRYLSKCFSDDWMTHMGYHGPEQRLGTVADILKFKGGDVEFADPEESLGQVARRMSELGISQMPVRRDGTGADFRMIHELDLLQSLVRGERTTSDRVEEAANALRGRVGLNDSLSAVQAVFDDENVAIVLEKEEIVGVVTKIDVVEYLAART